jgi:hypothetical protein
MISNLKINTSLRIFGAGISPLSPNKSVQARGETDIPLLGRGSPDKPVGSGVGQNKIKYPLKIV